MPVLLAALLDAAAVVLFAVIGTRSHDEALGPAGVLEVAAPFLIAAALGWLLARAWRRPAAPVTGVVVWAVAVAGGVGLRALVFDRGIAPGFVVVTALFLGLLVIGWRVVAGRAGGARARPRRGQPG